MSDTNVQQVVNRIRHVALLLIICVLCYALHLFFSLRWRELCGMREARKNHGLVVVNNRIYAVGGQGALGTKTHSYYPLTETEYYCNNITERSSMRIMQFLVVFIP